MDDIVTCKQSKTLSQGWHKITLSNAAKFEKDVVLASLTNGSTQTFIPVCFVKHGSDFTFHVESPSAAACLKNLDKKISVTHNFLMKIKVAPSPPPKHFLNDEVKQKIKSVMSARYNAANKALDMKSFHNDRLFVGDSAYVPLSRSNVMNNVIRIIGENVADMEAVDFSENKLPSLENFTLLEEFAPNLKILDLSNNRLNDIRELEKLKSLNIRVIDLRNNALVSKFKERSDYIEKVRDILGAKLEVLDGETLPKKCVFEDGSILLPSIKLMSVNDQIKQVMLEFIRQYIDVYDQDDRSPLSAAYHPNSMFSMCAAYPAGTTAHGASKLTHYIVDSRNLNLIIQPNKRMSFLKLGNANVIKFLNDMPKTKHDLNSFTLDIPIGNERLISVSLSGIFRERIRGENQPLRHFHRSFVIVPQGSGYLIVNDTLFITNPTNLEAKQAFCEEVKTAQPIVPLVSQEVAQKMIGELCSRTNLRPDWAQKCLEEHKWNLDLAVAMFQITKNEGKIPQEAYAFTV